MKVWMIGLKLLKFWILINFAGRIAISLLQKIKGSDLVWSGTKGSPQCFSHSKLAWPIIWNPFEQKMWSAVWNRCTLILYIWPPETRNCSNKMLKIKPILSVKQIHFNKIGQLLTNKQTASENGPQNYHTKIIDFLLQMIYLTANVDWSLWEASFLIVFGTPTVDIVIILCPICTSLKTRKTHQSLADTQNP